MAKATTQVVLDQKEIVDIIREAAKKYAGQNGVGSGSTIFFGIENGQDSELRVEKVVCEFSGAPKEK